MSILTLLVGVGPVAAAPSSASGSPGSTASIALIETFDASRGRTLATLEHEIHVLPEDFDRLKNGLSQEFEAALEPVGEAVTKIKEIIDRDFGAFDGLSPERRKVKLTAAMGESRLAEALGQLPTAIGRSLQEQGQTLLSQKVEDATYIVRQHLATDLASPLNELVLREFAKKIQKSLEIEGQASRFQGKDQEPGIDHLLKSLAFVIARRVMGKIAERLGEGLLKNLIAKTVARFAADEWISTLPGGWVIDVILLAGGAAWDVVRLGSETREHLKQTVEKLYREDCKGHLEAELPHFADELRAVLEEQLTAARTAAREMLESEWAWVLLHEKSEGLVDYARGRNPEDVQASLHKVARAFGRRYATWHFVDKLGMVDKIGEHIVPDLVAQYGDPFMSLFSRQPEALASVANKASVALLKHVMQADDREAELTIVENFLTKVGNLNDESLAASVLLLRRLDPSWSLRAVNRKDLASLAPEVDNLQKLANKDGEGVVLELVRKILHDEPGESCWRGVLSNRQAAQLVRVLIQLGCQSYKSLVDIAGEKGEEKMAAFVDDFKGDAAMIKLLGEDRHIFEAYIRPNAGGVRGVNIWIQLRREYAGDPDDETFETAMQAIQQLDDPERVINKSMIEDLKAAHFRGLHVALQRVVAWVISLVGFGLRALLIVGLVVCVVIVGVSLIGLGVWRSVRHLWPGATATLASARTPPESAPSSGPAVTVIAGRVLSDQTRGAQLPPPEKGDGRRAT